MQSDLIKEMEEKVLEEVSREQDQLKVKEEQDKRDRSDLKEVFELPGAVVLKKMLFREIEYYTNRLILEPNESFLRQLQGSITSLQKYWNKLIDVMNEEE